MRVMILAQHFHPEAVAGAVLATELALDLVAHGHQVAFVTSAPSYPEGAVFRGYRNELRQVSLWDGVEVVRTWSYITPSKSTGARLLNYGTFSVSVFLGGLFARRPDVVFSYSPPLPLGLAAWLLSRLWRVPWILRVEDLFPDAAIAAGVLTNRLAIRVFQALERFIYRKALHISVISETFRQALLTKGVPDAKLSVGPVWADPGFVRPSVKQNAFSEAQGLADKFVVMYAGNMGHNSCLEDVLAAAEQLKAQPHIAFVLLGEGVKKDALQQAAVTRGLDNVRFFPYQPREMLSQVMATADVSVVTLNKQSFATSLPSKTFNIMASGRPILAVTPEESEVATLVRQIGCGVNVLPDDPGGLVKAILAFARMSPDDLAEMGLRGREVLVTEYSREHCVGQYERLIANVVAE